MTPESPPEIGENPPELPPTLSAVAKLAGVSSITVSRVVRLPGQVAPETRARVERAMRDCKLCEIGEGTNEVQRLVISRMLLDQAAA